MSLGDNELAVEIIKIYNDAAIERQQESGDRYIYAGAFADLGQGGDGKGGTPPHRHGH